MIFTGDWSDKIEDEELSKDVCNNGIFLGSCQTEKDCSWICYQLGEKYYIGLNSEYDIWLADKEDIEMYLG